jgi:hypothetical protein
VSAHKILFVASLCWLSFAIGAAFAHHLDAASERRSFDAAWRCCGGK